MKLLIRVFGFAGLLLLTMLPIVMIGVFSGFNPLFKSKGFYPVLLAVECLLFAVAAWGALAALKAVLRKQTRPDPWPAAVRPPLHLWLVSGGCLLLILALSPLYDWLAPWHGGGSINELGNQQGLMLMLAQLPWLLALHVVLFAPLAEELLFRGVFFNAFPKGWHSRLRWLLPTASALLFALLHSLPNHPGFVLYFLMGWLFGGLYLYTRRLRYPVAVHMLNNTLGFAALYFQA